MTVRELIESLSKIQDQNIRVMVRGYEGGWRDVMSIDPTPIEMALNVNTEWYYGKHENVENIDQATIGMYQIVQAIIL